MARKRKSDRDHDQLTPDMARVVVRETYAHKLRNGSVLVLDPKPGVQTVKREVAEALIRCGRGVRHRTDMKFTPESKGSD